jgi:hypothetical protein
VVAAASRRRTTAAGRRSYAARGLERARDFLRTNLAAACGHERNYVFLIVLLIVLISVLEQIEIKAKRKTMRKSQQASRCLDVYYVLGEE